MMPPERRTTVTVDASDARIPVTFRNLSYRVELPTKDDSGNKKQLQILKNLTGCFQPGKLTALMGPSGSGKTTLMDLLAGRKTMQQAHTEGSICYAGQPLQREMLSMVTGYVEQFDTLAGELTVREMLLYTAELKLPRTIGREERVGLVESVIRKLSLQPCADTKIGTVLQRGISGGQAKRTNIAMALITRPAVIYLDEPTSGLDSYTANEVVMLLKALAAEGRTVVCTIHSPTALAFSLFDELVMLRDGCLLYHGELRKAQPYFEKVFASEGNFAATTASGDKPLQLPEVVQPPFNSSGAVAPTEAADGTASAQKKDEQDVAISMEQELMNKHVADGTTVRQRVVTNDSAGSKSKPKRIDFGSFSLPEWLVDVTSGNVSQTTYDLEEASPAELLARSSSKEDTPVVAGATKDNKPAFSFEAVDLVAAFAGSPDYSELLNKVGELEKADPNDDRTAKLAAGYNPPSSFSKLKTLLRYRMRAHYKDPEFLGPRIGDKIFMGFIILSLYWDIGSQKDAQSILSCAAMLYFIVALCGYGAAAFVPSLTLDRPLYYRETADGCYGPLTYYLSKFVEESVLCSTTSLLLMIPVYYGCSLSGNLFMLILIYYTTAMVGIVLAYLCAAVCPTIDAANALLPTYVTVCMYFGGLFMIFSKIPDGWYWFSWISFLRYSWGAIMINNYQDDNLTEPGGLPLFFRENRPTNVLHFYELHGDIMGNSWACLGMVALQLVIFSALGALAIKSIRHQNR
ncbi:unnamed protein product [Amoebophrya sp. A120]|nr:unnamed protein product [Amoebophrya sp. A120]|eukprot:GSA120T00017472001.1